MTCLELGREGKGESITAMMDRSDWNGRRMRGSQCNTGKEIRGESTFWRRHSLGTGRGKNGEKVA